MARIRIDVSTPSVFGIIDDKTFINITTFKQHSYKTIWLTVFFLTNENSLRMINNTGSVGISEETIGDLNETISVK